jgi:flagellar biosynthetic protein FliP
MLKAKATRQSGKSGLRSPQLSPRDYDNCKRFRALIFTLLPLLLLLSDAATAQTINIDMGEQGGSAASQIIRLIALVTILSLAPSILVMMTSFTRIIVVLSLLRSAMGIQQTPPNSVLISLALFLTLFIMMPTFEAAYEQGIAPLIEEEITEREALEAAAQPFHAFMLQQVREKDVETFMEMAGNPVVESPEALPYRILIPAFMISELRRAFEIGFLVFVPFLIIDMMVSATLMSMGMMMLPPIIVSLPFKILLFVLVDGWYLLIRSLVSSFHM